MNVVRKYTTIQSILRGSTNEKDDQDDDEDLTNLASQQLDSINEKQQQQQGTDDFETLSLFSLNSSQIDPTSPEILNQYHHHLQQQQQPPQQQLDYNDPFHDNIINGDDDNQC